ncbi:MAG TPA: AraC family transcriptional regulator [Chitinophagaceae bacterium]|nr:AraC family transcriptional regulator [Chitinophagaceae bacterium]
MKAKFEMIIQPEANSYKAYAYEKKEFDTPFHYHPEYELTYILSSHGMRYVGNDVSGFQQNDLVLLGPNLPHCWKNISPQKEKAGAIVFHWGNDLLGEHWIEKKEFKYIGALLSNAEKGIQFDSDFAKSIKDKMLFALKNLPFKNLLTLLDILNDLAHCNSQRVISSDAFGHKINPVDFERIQNINQYLEKNLRNKINLKKIASTVHLSEESFSRFFSKVMNKTFFSFLNEYRINIACKLLSGSGKNIAEVAYAAGFESLPFFYRQFKKYKHCSPMNYRNTYAEV